MTIGVALCLSACGRLGYQAEPGADDAPTPFLVDSAPLPPDAAPLSPDAIRVDSGFIGHYLTNAASPEDNALGSGADGQCAFCPSLATERSVTTYDFDGSSTYVRIPYDPRFAGENGFSVALWVKPRSYTLFMSIASKVFGSDAANSWKIENAGHSLHFESYSGTDIERLGTGLIPLPLATWSHVAITWDGQSKRLYWNGVLHGADVTSVQFDSGDIYIGADYDYGNVTNFFDGLMRDIRLYNRKLSDIEIAAIVAQSAL